MVGGIEYNYWGRNDTHSYPLGHSISLSSLRNCHQGTSFCRRSTFLWLTGECRYDHSSLSIRITLLPPTLDTLKSTCHFAKSTTTIQNQLPIRAILLWLCYVFYFPFQVKVQLHAHTQTMILPNHSSGYDPYLAFVWLTVRDDVLLISSWFSYKKNTDVWMFKHSLCDILFSFPLCMCVSWGYDKISFISVSARGCLFLPSG